MERKKNVLVHHYSDSGFDSIVAFSDSVTELEEISRSCPHYGSLRHDFIVLKNCFPQESLTLISIKDDNLIKLCENVAQYLSFGEYHMRIKSYFKAQSWFEYAKDSAAVASWILDNY